ncbi:MAG: hypothetical protein QXQ84_04205 [Nitrososphaerota archaeon]
MVMSTIIYQKGLANGKITVEFSGKISPEAALEACPEFKNMLSEIKEKGWRYFYIEMEGSTFIELDFTGNPSKILPYSFWGKRTFFSINIDIGEKLPEAKIKSVDMFKINVSTKDLPRAVTIDLSKKLIIYIDESFWNWQEEWRNDESKRSLALEVFKIVKWLIEEKGYRLDEKYDVQRYKELEDYFE